MPQIEKRKCPRCILDLPLDAFAHSSKRGHQTYCRKCNTEYKREWLKENRSKVATSRIWSMYRLRPEEFQLLLQVQEGRCALCNDELDPPSIDHDHRCCRGPRSCGNCIRGLTCQRCNLMLGLIETQPDIEQFLQRILKHIDTRFDRPAIKGSLTHGNTRR